MKTTADILRLIKSIFREDKAYAVGGWLRDNFTGRPNRDLDITCLQDPLKHARRFARAAGGRIVPLDRVNKVYRVVLSGNPGLEFVDFSRMKAPGIVADLLKRDFTVNSMAAEIEDGGKISLERLIDPAGGIRDLRKRLIRMTSAAAFKDDPLRMLRAFRIAAELDFAIDRSLLRSVKADSALISRSSPERVRDELVRILSVKDASRWIALLEKSGLLERILPEVTPMKRSARKFYFHPKGLWQHSMETLSSLENIYAGLYKLFPDTARELEVHMNTPLSAGMDRKTLLKFASILHDCAKPECARRMGKKTRFLGHEARGSAYLEKIMRRLKMSSKEMAIAGSVTASHMRPVSLSQSGMVTQKASFRLFRDMGSNTIDLLLLALADWHSYKRLKTHKPKNLKVQEVVIRELLSRYFAQRTKQSAPKLLDGNILMKHLKLKPGPVIGALLREITEAQALGKIKNRKEALALASRKLTLLAKKYKINL